MEKGSKKYQEGLKIWRHLGGVPYADQMLENLKKLSPDLAQFVIEKALGEIWTRPQLDLKSRSLCTVTALAALGKPNQLRFHIRGALHNGATREEICEVLLMLALYCGMPAAVEAFTVAQQVFEDYEKEKQR